MNYKEFKEVYKVDTNELRERFGVPYNTLYAWEAGTRKPPAWVINLFITIYKGGC